MISVFTWIKDKWESTLTESTFESQFLADKFCEWVETIGYEWRQYIEDN